MFTGQIVFKLYICSLFMVAWQFDRTKIYLIKNIGGAI